MESNESEPLLSVVIPVYNEVENLHALYSALTKTLENASISFELILVDDGSSDGSDEIIKGLSQADPRVRYAKFTRNFGHEAASTCGFRMVRGKAAVLMDADLQDPPEVILEMLQKWQEGYQIVYARRVAREGETALKKFTSHLFYRIINIFSETDIPVDVGDFRLVDREVVSSFNCLTERNRFVRGLFSWLGYRQTFVEYQRPPRKGGSTKYNLPKLMFLSMDAIFGFSLAPLRICILVGLGRHFI